MFGLIPRRNRNGGPLTRVESPLQAMQEEFETLFDRLFRGFPLVAGENAELPRVWGLDMEETEKEVVVRAELPGFEPGELDVRLRENVLTIEARHEEAEGKEGEGKASRSVHVRRSVTLPTGLDGERVEAGYKNGVLELRIPRSAETQPRRIEVKG